MYRVDPERELDGPLSGLEGSTGRRLRDLMRRRLYPGTQTTDCGGA